MRERESFIQDEHLLVDIEREPDQNLIRKKLRQIFGEEGADQLVFVLNTLAAEDANEFFNRCSEAVKQLGRLLKKQFGGDESFFDLVQNSHYFELKGRHLTEKLGYRGDYHSIGAIVLPPTLNVPKGISVAIDFTYSTVNPMAEKPRIIFIIPGDLKALSTKITAHYGGIWATEFKLEQATGRYTYIEK